MVAVTLQALVSSWLLEDSLSWSGQDPACGSYRLVCQAGQVTVSLLMGSRELGLLAATLEQTVYSLSGSAAGDPSSSPGAALPLPLRIVQDGSHSLHLTLTCQRFHASAPSLLEERNTGRWELGVDDGQGAHVFLVLSAPDVGALLAEVHAALQARRLGARLKVDQAVQYLALTEQALRRGEQPAVALPAWPLQHHDEADASAIENPAPWHQG